MKQVRRLYAVTYGVISLRCRTMEKALEEAKWAVKRGWAKDPLDLIDHIYEEVEVEA